MYQLYNEDCLKVLKTLDEGSIDCVVCDPPYKTQQRGSSGDMGGWLASEEGMNGNGGFSHNDLSIDDYAPLLFNVMKDGAHGYLMTNDLNLVAFHEALKNCGFSVFKTLIWAKNNVIANQYYMNSHEYIIFFRKGHAVSINNRGTRSVLSFPNPKNKAHPSEKPIELVKVLIENSTKEGDTVLDFTMGSGSTGSACMRTNRRFIGIELDKEYFELSEDRIETAAIQYGRKGDTQDIETESSVVSLASFLGLQGGV